MAFSSTIFKSPLIKSKLKKTVVSSSIFRGKRLTDGSLLKPESKPERTLIETNNILLEIQKQLAIDFAYRIQKEEKDIKKIKKVNENVKRSNLSGGLFSNIVGSFTKPITNIVKGTFSRILEFFGWLAAGFAVNKALKWLSDNPEKIDKTFNFITKHWKLITGIVVGAIIGKVLLKLAGTVLLLRRILKSIPGIGRRGGASGGGSSTSTLASGNKLFRNLYRKGTKVDTKLVNTYDRYDPYQTRPKGGFFKWKTTTTRNPLAQNIHKLKGIKPFMKKFGFLKGKGIPLVNFGLDVAMGEDVDRAAAGAAGVWGGFAAGQALIPIPILGGIIGGMLGSYIAKEGYSASKRALTGGLTKDKSNNNIVEVLNSIDLTGGSSSSIDGSSSVGGDSVPFVGSEDFSNEYNVLYKDLLGIYN